MSVLFKDSEGREWHVRMTVAAVDRILELCKVDLYEEDGWGKVLKDPRVACAVLGAVLMPAIEQRGVTMEQFRDSLDGDAAFAGIAALHEAIVNFTQPELRATRQKILERINETLAQQAKLEQQRLDSGMIEKLIEAEMKAAHKKVEDNLEKRLASLSGEQQGSLESIHAN